MKTVIKRKLFKSLSKSGLLTGSAIGILTAGILTSPVAFAASGTTQVDITFPPLVILYYYDNIDIAVDADDLSAMIANGVTSCTAGSAGGVAELECSTSTDPLLLGTSTDVTGTQVTYSPAIEGDANVSPVLANTDLTFVIENSWAVRALGGTLAATIATGGGNFSAPFITPAVPTSSLTLTDGANVGDVQFDVDLTSITGLVASDTLIITVTSTP